MPHSLAKHLPVMGSPSEYTEETVEHTEFFSNGFSVRGVKMSSEYKGSPIAHIECASGYSCLLWEALGPGQA